MSNLVGQCETHLAKYHGHSSSFFMTLMVVAVCGFIAPSLLYAAEIESSVANPVPALKEFRQEKPKVFSTSSPDGKMMGTSTFPYKGEKLGVFSSSSQQKIIQYRNERIKRLITALLALENSSKTLRLELEKIQTTSPTSTKAINLGQVQKQINEILNQFKKTNFNSEFIRLRSELNTEQNKRVTAEKKEVQKQKLKAEQQKRELLKKQAELNRENLKKEQELMREQSKNILPGAASTTPAQTPAPSTATSS